MPSSLIIAEPEVNMAETGPSWLGGFNDVYRGTYKQQAVAIKRYRVGLEMPTLGEVCDPPRCNSCLAHDAG
jgi:hypothetical protein